MSISAAPSFSSLGLSTETLRALTQAGFAQPTPIQARAIPIALTGSDVIGCAATGTGKTAAFALPALEHLVKNPESRVLVLAPTRELAKQIADQFIKFSVGRSIHTALLIGGVGMEGQTRALQRARVIVATPGRLIDHARQGTARLDGVRFLVLDEADRMLDMGFKPQLTRIMALVPKQRQTLLFSATMAGEVETFARTHLKAPQKVEVSPSGSTAARAEQVAYEIPQLEKTALLMAILNEQKVSTLVFTRTRRRADKLARSLERAGHRVARIHADRSQAQRAQALEGFRHGRFTVLVATDVASRGIDVANIAHVVNFDLPHVPEDYVHRIGRTARASASGRASSFIAREEAGLMRDIERFTRSRIARAEVPRSSPVFTQELQDSAARQADPGPSQQAPAQRSLAKSRQPPRRGFVPRTGESMERPASFGVQADRRSEGESMARPPRFGAQPERRSNDRRPHGDRNRKPFQRPAARPN